MNIYDLLNLNMSGISKDIAYNYKWNRMNIEPLCLTIFNDAKECLFQSDSSVYNCK